MVKSKPTNRLRVLRAERDVTQMDLALKAGMGLTRYWKIETGYIEPSETERARLAKALRVDESDLGFPLQAARAS